MTLSVLQENLLKGLATVGRAVATRTTLPVLYNVLLDWDEHRLTLTANNLEMAIQTEVEARGGASGRITVPARLLSEFVNALPPERIDIELDESTQSIELRCGRYDSTIKGIDAGEFPGIVPIDPEAPVVRLDGSRFRTMIRQVAFAAASDEARPVFTGVLLSFGEDFTMAAADGYRLSVVHDKWEGSFGAKEGFQMIVPGRFLAELGKIIKDEAEQVEIIPADSRRSVAFRIGCTMLVSQLIDGEFPDFTRIIPKVRSTHAILDRKNLLAAVRVSGLFARDSANIIRVNLTPAEDGGVVTLASSSAEMGDNESQLIALVEGVPLEIAFNSKYMLDFLSAADEAAQVSIETNNPATPGVFRQVGDDSYLHVIMPMHIASR